MFRRAAPAFVVVFLVVMFVLYHHVIALSADSTPPPIVPDLAFFYECPASHDMMADDVKIDHFLIRGGFQVGDVGEFRREQGVSQIYPQSIVAIDDQKRWINISEELDGLNHSVTLESEPPTVHSLKLEQDLLAFITNDLKCEISHVTRNSNPVSAKENYDELFADEVPEFADYHSKSLP